MRRERIITLMAVLTTTLGVVAAAPGVASAASPMEICQALADGTLAGTISADDPTIQGYCNPLVVVTQNVVNAAPAAQETANAVAGAQKTASGPTSGVQGATKVKRTAAPAKSSPGAVSPAQRSAAPLAATKSAGTLPFTGTELGIFAVVGLALLSGGFLLRLTARQKRSRA